MSRHRTPSKTILHQCFQYWGPWTLKVTLFAERKSLPIITDKDEWYSVARETDSFKEEDQVKFDGSLWNSALA